MKKPIGIKIIGWYFILQGWIALGQYHNLGNWAIVLVALFIGIGIGILKLHNIARIASIVFFAVLSCISFFITIKVSNQNLDSTATGQSLAILIFCLILLTILSIYFTRLPIISLFTDKNITTTNKDNLIK